MKKSMKTFLICVLIPANPESEAAMESYEELYPFRPPVINIKDCPNADEHDPK